MEVKYSLLLYISISQLWFNKQYLRYTFDFFLIPNFSNTSFFRAFSFFFFWTVVFCYFSIEISRLAKYHFPPKSISELFHAVSFLFIFKMLNLVFR